MFERHFGLLACGVVLIWAFVRVFDFTLIPPTYNGLVIELNSGDTMKAPVKAGRE